MKMSEKAKKRKTIIIALINRVALAFGSVFLSIIGLLYMTPHTEFYLSFGVEEDIDREYYLDAFNFGWGIVFLLVAFFAPLLVDYFIYHLGFRIKKISKWWIMIPDIVLSLALLAFVFICLFVFDNHWAEAEWR